MNNELDEINVRSDKKTIGDEGETNGKRATASAITCVLRI